MGVLLLCLPRACFNQRRSGDWRLPKAATAAAQCIRGFIGVCSAGPCRVVRHVGNGVTLEVPLLLGKAEAEQRSKICSSQASKHVNCSAAVAPHMALN